MIVTDDFVYVHMPKTGGTFVEAALGKLLLPRGGLYLDTSTPSGRARLGARDQHQTVSEIPSIYRDRPIAFTVRNPYDHLVSYFEFAWWRKHPGDTFDEERIRARYPWYPEIDFLEYLAANYRWDLLDKGYIDEHTARRLEAAGVGPMTYEYVRFLAERPAETLERIDQHLTPEAFRMSIPDVSFLRMETLNRDLYDFVVARGYEAEAAHFILQMGKIYPEGSTRPASREWMGYYTPEARRLVRRRERLLFALFPEYDLQGPHGPEPALDPTSEVEGGR